MQRLPPARECQVQVSVSQGNLSQQAKQTARAQCTHTNMKRAGEKV